MIDLISSLYLSQPQRDNISSACVDRANGRGIGASATGCALSTVLATGTVSTSAVLALTANATCEPLLTFLFLPTDNTLMLIFTEPVIPLAATAATAALPATASVRLADLQITLAGSATPSTTTLTPVVPVPETAIDAIGASTASSAVAYLLDLHLTPPAAGGEQLAVTLPANTLLGIYGGVVVPQTALSQPLTDRRSPTFAADRCGLGVLGAGISKCGLMPASLHEDRRHPTSYTIALAFNEPVVAAAEAGGSAITMDLFTISVSGGGIVTYTNGSFLLTLPSPSSPPPPLLPDLPSTPLAASPIPSSRLRSLQSVQVSATPSGTPGSTSGTGSISRFELLLVIDPNSYPSGTEEVTISALAGAISDIAGNPLLPDAISAGLLGAAAPAPPPMPYPPPVPFNGTSPEGVTAGLVAGVGIGGVLAVLLCCCLMFLLLWLRKRRKAHKISDESALETVHGFMAAADDGGKEGAARKLRTLKEIMSIAAQKHVDLVSAADEVLNNGSVLPPQLSASLANEYARRHGASSAVDDTKKLELLEGLLRPPPLPPGLLAHAHADFLQTMGRAASSDSEALLLMKNALDPHVAARSDLSDADHLRTAVEEERDTDVGYNGGGGARLRPPPLKPVADLRPLPDAPVSFDISTLPLAALEASSAMFGHEAAPLLSKDGEGKVSRHIPSPLSTLYPTHIPPARIQAAEYASNVHAFQPSLMRPQLTPSRSQAHDLSHSALLALPSRFFTLAGR